MNTTFRIFIRYNYIKANHYPERWCLMYKVNEIVAYSSQGICEITEICQREIAGTVMDYYVMKPVFDSRSTVFVPVSNEKLVSRIRKTMTASEAYPQWDLIETVELNVFVDDGKGFVDLGLDNIFTIDGNDLIFDYDKTWTTVNGTLVSYLPRLSGDETAR